MLAMTAVLASCAPVPHLWPSPRDPRIRRDGKFLRVYGASLKSSEAAEADARRNLRSYLESLGIPGENRDLKIASVLEFADAWPTHDAPDGYSSVIELSLEELQQALETKYE